MDIHTQLAKAERLLRAWADYDGPMGPDDAFDMQEQAQRYFSSLKCSDPDCPYNKQKKAATCGCQ